MKAKRCSKCQLLGKIKWQFPQWSNSRVEKSSRNKYERNLHNIDEFENKLRFEVFCTLRVEHQIMGHGQIKLKKIFTKIKSMI